ncbi:MAG: homoserine kinase [Candidatus Bathyarchaeota archaeon]|nr:homoserine kinase [Candidatus Bathyarchaeota archaeon]
MPPISQVTVKAPATSANLGPGFDVFGLALEQPHDTVTLTAVPEKGVKIQVSNFKPETIAQDPHRNTAGIVATHMIQEFSLKEGISIDISKGICPSRGMGSSAASAAAAAVGINHMFDLKLDTKQLIRLAAKGEVASAGWEHADNVSAAICGGFIIIRSYNPLEVISLKAPANMELSVAFPHMITPAHKTKKARLVVPQMVSTKKLVHNVGNAAAMVSGFARGDVDLIGRAMSDAVVEPARAGLIPGFAAVKEGAVNAGACGVTISGAGPAVLAVVNKENADAQNVAVAMKEGFRSAGFDATAFATKPGSGVSIVIEE